MSNELRNPLMGGGKPSYWPGLGFLIAGFAVKLFFIILMAVPWAGLAATLLDSIGIVLLVYTAFQRRRLAASGTRGIDGSGAAEIASPEEGRTLKRGAILTIAPSFFLLSAAYGLYILLFILIKRYHPDTGLNIRNIPSLPLFMAQGFLSTSLMIVCGIGLFARREWARRLYLVATPFAIGLLFVYLLIIGRPAFGILSVLGYALFSFLLTRKHVKERLH